MRMCDSGHDSLASEDSSNTSMTTPSPPPPPETPSNTSTSNTRQQSFRAIGQPPPNITPVGGVPNFNNKTGLVRPIAFRPTPSKDNSQQPFRPQQLQQQNRLGQNEPEQVYQQQSQRPNVRDFAPGHPLAKKGNKYYGSSQDLTRPPQQGNLNKFSSLDRRTLTKRYQQNNVVSQNQPSPTGQGGLSLTPYTPGQEHGVTQPHVTGPTVKPHRGNKEPERRHSSYNPASSLTRTPSQNSEYRLRLGGSGDPRRQFQTPSSATKANSSMSENNSVNPMNVLGLPETFRSQVNSNSNSRPQSVRSATGGEGGRTRLSGAGTPQFSNGGRFGGQQQQGSLNNLNSLVTHGSPSGPTSLKRSDSSSTTRGNKTTSNCGGDGYIDESDGIYSQIMSHNGDFTNTPSPADSAVGDLEIALREKDNEIVYLRDTLEQNEQVIFRVYEEKEKTWERELRKIKSLYETQLKTQQMKASKMEAALVNQSYQIKSEKKKLEQEMATIKEEAKKQKEDNEELKNKLNHSRTPIEDKDQNKGSEPSMELSDSQSKDVEEMGDDNNADLHKQIETYKEELKEAKAVIDDLMENRKKLADEVAKLKDVLGGIDEDFSIQEIKAQKAIIIERDKELESVRHQLEKTNESRDMLKNEYDCQREHFEIETANWLSEKEKVIRYQKQLQLNYVSMYKKNKVLEKELEDLKGLVSESQQQGNQQSASVQKPGHVSSAKAKLFSKFSSKFSD